MYLCYGLHSVIGNNKLTTQRKSASVPFRCLLREERRLRVFENRVLRKVFGPKREKVMRWKKNA